MRLAPLAPAAAALCLAIVARGPQDPVPTAPPATAPPATALPATAPQDPVRVPRAPVGAEPLPPVPDPPTTPVARRDLLGAFAPATGYEGFYRLTGVALGGRVLREGVRGYLAVGRQHLALQILQASAPGSPPLVQAGFRRYRVEDRTLVTTALVGHDNLRDGKLRFEPIGFEERRGLERSPTTLRVVRDAGTWMEFVRIE